MQLDYNFTLLLMVFLRMTGFIIFNPIFGRKNIPNLFKVGLTLLLTLFVYAQLPNAEAFEIATIAEFVVVGIKELALGYVIGFIVNMFLTVLILAGEIMDMQIGISMAKIYDPASNVSMPISASLLNVMMLVIFFLSNGHLTLIRIFLHSGQAIPYGELAFSAEVFRQISLMFSTILLYSVKMAMPLLAVELISEMGVGLIMKAVPQINVFVINLQLKIIIGFAMIFILIPPFAAFIEKLFSLMFDNIDAVLGTLG